MNRENLAAAYSYKCAKRRNRARIRRNQLMEKISSFLVPFSAGLVTMATFTALVLTSG